MIGGASSGKSAYAEGLIAQTGRPRVYIATAQAFDAEMDAKIADHKAARGPDWETREAPLDIAGALADIGPERAVLLDCATLWLTNVVLGEHDYEAEAQAFLAALAAASAPVVVVSNETGLGIVPENALARRFRVLQGRLNQALAAKADTVVTVIAGLPLALKGDLP